ncbi:MAG TPA: HD domain-containing phosphohydrolase, partial [Longimicrobiales bacterium]
IANIRGDCERALERYQSALDRYRAMGDTHGAARVLNNIGMAYVDMQRWSDAETAYDQALFSAEVQRDAETLGTVQLNRAELYLKCERFDDARACCDQAFEIFGRIASTSGLGETYKVYGTLYRASGKLHLAEAHLALVAELAQDADHPLLEAEAERENALVLLEQGRKAEALKSLNRSHRLFTNLKARHALIDLDRQLDELERSYMQVVKAWAESIESKDQYTAGHCARVADYTCALARACGISGRDLSWIRMGAFLHDVGKTGVTAKILNKKGRLTDGEWQLMRAHTTIGDEIVAGLDFPYDIRPIVRSHHERWAGGGYPDNLSGEAIPLIARILCIADVFDALTTDRSYRPAYPRSEALALMAAEAGTMLDPKLFELFRNLIESHGLASDAQNDAFAAAATLNNE